MITKRKITKIAKLMFKKSLKENQLDNLNVVKIVQKIIKLKPDGYLKILNAYKKLIAAKNSQETLTIESATPISGSLQKEILTQTGARYIQVKINKNLVFGAKIIHGDWVYEATLDAKLEQLTNAQ